MVTDGRTVVRHLLRLLTLLVLVIGATQADVINIDGGVSRFYPGYEPQFEEFLVQMKETRGCADSGLPEFYCNPKNKQSPFPLFRWKGRQITEPRTSEINPIRLLASRSTPQLQNPNDDQLSMTNKPEKGFFDKIGDKFSNAKKTFMKYLKKFGKSIQKYNSSSRSICSRHDETCQRADISRQINRLRQGIKCHAMDPECNEIQITGRILLNDMKELNRYLEWINRMECLLSSEECMQRQNTARKLMQDINVYREPVTRILMDNSRIIDCNPNDPNCVTYDDNGMFVANNRIIGNRVFSM